MQVNRETGGIRDARAPLASGRFLTSVEVATACGVSPRTVSNWIRDGAIAAHRTVGGHGRVSVNELRRFLVSRGMPVPPGLAADGPAAPDGSLPPARPPRAAGVGEPVGASSSPAPEAQAEPRVLVIDDDETLLSVMQEVLGAQGFRVETARHGFLAGYLVGHYRPDVVLLDIMMPGLDGYEVLSLMRRRPEARGIPVVACTSLKGSDVEQRLQTAGFDGYVRKPVDFRALVTVLRGLAG
jgi:excisionase family DNA binding protein